MCNAAAVHGRVLVVLGVPQAQDAPSDRAVHAEVHREILHGSWGGVQRQVHRSVLHDSVS